MIPTPKSILCSLVNLTMEVAAEAKIADMAYIDKIVNQAAETALKVMKDNVLFMRNDYSFWTVPGVLRRYMKVAGITLDQRVEQSRQESMSSYYSKTWVKLGLYLENFCSWYLQNWQMLRQRLMQQIK